LKNQNQPSTESEPKSNEDKLSEEFEELMRKQMEWECREEKGMYE
jgi:hypothetical protein